MKQSYIVLLVAVVVVAAAVAGFVILHNAGNNQSPYGVLGTGLPVAENLAASPPSGGATAQPGQPAGQPGSATLPPVASGTIAVPAQYQSTYSGLQQNLNAYDAEVGASWNGAAYPVNYATELISANCNQGTAVLTRGLAPVQGELNGLQALGVKAVTICIGYPLLDQAFWNSPLVNQPQYYSQFLTYYQDVVQAIHAKHMKVIVEADALFRTGVPTNLVSELSAYYKNLTFAQFESGRAADAVVIASEIKPDYLLIQTEPSSEAYQAYRPELNNPTEDVAMVAAAATALDNANIPGLHSSIVVGSGFGSWQSGWQSYLSGLLKISGLDLIDTHNYFTSNHDIDNELSIVNQIKQSGKQMGMSEYWLKKSLDGGPSLTTPIFTDPTDDYGFWAPLDQQFIRLMYVIANENKFAYTSAFNDLQLFAYVDYNQTQSQICGGQTCTSADNAKIAAASDQAASQGFKSGTLSTTGTFFKNLITTGQ